MFPPCKLAVVVPCHNEAIAITTLVREIKRHVAHVIVIDDGSTDKTTQNALSAGAEVLRNEVPQGKGAALNKGWAHALKSGFDFALTMDGDGQHSPADIPKFLAALEQGAAPLVIGNRMAEAHKIPGLRRFVNRWMSKRLSRVAGCELVDTQCGFRLIDLRIWSTLELRTSHFEIESEVLLAFLAAGNNVHFVPIEVIYKSEQSKIRPLRDTIRWFKWLWGLSSRNANGRNKFSSVTNTTITSKTNSIAENV